MNILFPLKLYLSYRPAPRNHPGSVDYLPRTWYDNAREKHQSRTPKRSPFPVLLSGVVSDPDTPHPTPARPTQKPPGARATRTRSKKSGEKIHESNQKSRAGRGRKPHARTADALQQLPSLAGRSWPPGSEDPAADPHPGPDPDPQQPPSWALQPAARPRESLATPGGVPPPHPQGDRLPPVAEIPPRKIFQRKPARTKLRILALVRIQIWQQLPSLATAAGHQDATVAAMAARIQLRILTLVRILICSSCLPGRHRGRFSSRPHDTRSQAHTRAAALATAAAETLTQPPTL